MKIDDKMIDKIAKLAYLEFEKDEKEQIRKDLERIITFVDKLKELHTENVEPLVYLSDTAKNLRSDEPSVSITHEDALLNAPQTDGKFFLVPKIIDKSKRK